MEVAEDAGAADEGVAAGALFDETGAAAAAVLALAAARASSGSMNSTFNARPVTACENKTKQRIAESTRAVLGPSSPVQFGNSARGGSGTVILQQANIFNAT